SRETSTRSPIESVGSAAAASSAPCRSATTMRAPSAASASALARPMPMAPPVTIATRSSSLATVAHLDAWRRRERRGDQDLVLHRDQEGPTLLEVLLPALLAHQPRAPLAAVLQVLVGPQVHDLVERAD